MNGPHDMGGKHGFGPVQPEANEPLFHAPWERRALGLTLAMGATGSWNIDMARSARENIGFARYLSSSYYQIWLQGLQSLMLERGLVSSAELESGHAQTPGLRLTRVLQADNVSTVLARGSPTARVPSAPARFAVGKRVRAKNLQPAGHTRLPGYVRGHVGTISLVHGAHVFADRHAVCGASPGFDEAPTWLYTVVFDGQDLWGDGGEAATQVSVDAWEPYLEACAEQEPT
jgi:nitrile hydratase subunit beta